MDRYRQVSPERTKVWTEKSPKYSYNHHHSQHQLQKNHKVPVVYYLCRNRQLEHPHSIEVPLSSPNGIYLRDVIERISVLRGRRAASMYSWSCKRSYKTGYVWHDLCDDDLIVPVNGNEYVLKGSEIFEEFDSGSFNPAERLVLRNPKMLPEPVSARSREEDSSPSSSLNGRTTKSSQDDEMSPPARRACSLAVSPESSKGKVASLHDSLSPTEYKVNKHDGLADASTQTDEKGSSSVETRDVSTTVLLINDGASEPNVRGIHQNQVSRVKQTTPSVSTPPSPIDRTDTLESLIRADMRKLNNFRILEEEKLQTPSTTKLKASDMILQLITCGSLSVKDHTLGLIPTYKPRFPQSPSFSKASVPRDDCLTDNPHPHALVMRSEDKEERSSTISKGSKQQCKSMRSSPLSGEPKISSRRVENSNAIIPSVPKQQSIKADVEEDVIKIEERLASGARIIIQSKVCLDS